MSGKVLFPMLKIFGAVFLQRGVVARLIVLTALPVLMVSCGPNPAPGISYQHDKVPSVPWSIHVVKIARSRPDLELHTMLSQGTVVGLSTLVDQIQALPPDAGVPVAALNGDFYVVDPGSPYLGDPRGLQILGGELVSAPTDQASFWLDVAGHPQATNVISQLKVTWPDGSVTPIGLNEERVSGAAVLYTPRFSSSTKTRGGRELTLERTGGGLWLPLQAGREYSAQIRQARPDGDSPLTKDVAVLSLSPALLTNAPAAAQAEAGTLIKISTDTVPALTGVRTAISGGYVLVRGGQKQPLHVPQSEAYKYRSVGERHPRSAVGVSRDYIYLVEVDGRQPKLSVGMTLAELRDYMQKLGCELALSLDGGASATLWLNGKVMNSPCDGANRPIANGLVVLQKPKRR